MRFGVDTVGTDSGLLYTVRSVGYQLKEKYSHVQEPEAQ